jgi:hypothetical protein
LYSNAQWFLWFNAAKISKEKFRVHFNSRVYGNTSVYIYSSVMHEVSVEISDKK